MTIPVELVNAAMSSGLSSIRPIARRGEDPYGWNFGSARMPSYWAYGRMRALHAIIEAERLRPRRVLEVAAGDAALCASLRERTGCEVVANDLREANLREALEAFSNGKEISILPGNVFEIPPESVQPFDLVIACEIIEHVAHGVEFLQHLGRLMTKDGRILLTTPNGSHFRNVLPGYYDIPDHSVLESRQFKPDADGHLFLIRPSELHRMAKEAGLVVERIELWGSPFVTGHGMLRLFSGILPRAFCLKMESTIAGRWERLCFAMSAVLRRA